MGAFPRMRSPCTWDPSMCNQAAIAFSHMEVTVKNFLQHRKVCSPTGLCAANETIAHRMHVSARSPIFIMIVIPYDRLFSLVRRQILERQFASYIPIHDFDSLRARGPSSLGLKVSPTRQLSST